MKNINAPPTESEKNNSIKEKYRDKRVLKISEAAEYVNVSRGMIEHWLATGLLPCEDLPGSGKRIYRFRRIRKEELDAFFNRHHDTHAYPLYSKSDTENFLLPRKA